MFFFKWFALFICIYMINFGHTETMQYRVTRSNYKFSTYFNMANEAQSFGAVTKKNSPPLRVIMLMT